MKKLFFLCIGFLLHGFAQAEVIEIPNGVVRAKNDTMVFFQNSDCGLQPVDTVIGLYSKVNNFVANYIQPSIPRHWCCKSYSYPEIVNLYRGGKNRYRKIIKKRFYCR